MFGLSAFAELPFATLTYGTSPGWVVIDDTQSPSWQNIGNSQTPAWSSVTNTQAPGWTQIQT